MNFEKIRENSWKFHDSGLCCCDFANMFWENTMQEVFPTLSGYAAAMTDARYSNTNDLCLLISISNGNYSTPADRIFSEKKNYQRVRWLLMLVYNVIDFTAMYNCFSKLSRSNKFTKTACKSRFHADQQIDFRCWSEGKFQFNFNKCENQNHEFCKSFVFPRKKHNFVTRQLATEWIHNCLMTNSLEFSNAKMQQIFMMNFTYFVSLSIPSSGTESVGNWT